MYKICKEFRFEAGHRLMKHEGKCKNLHGHSYRVEIELTAQHLDDNGMVIDFYCLASIKDWLMKNFDHVMVLNELDDDNILFCKNRDYCVLVLSCEPTAENIAYFILLNAQVILDSAYPKKKVLVSRVRVWETTTSYGEKIA